jgi:hypothetical protein
VDEGADQAADAGRLIADPRGGRRIEDEGVLGDVGEGLDLGIAAISDPEEPDELAVGTAFSAFGDIRRDADRCATELRDEIAFAARARARAGDASDEFASVVPEEETRVASHVRFPFDPQTHAARRGQGRAQRAAQREALTPSPAWKLG